MFKSEMKVSFDYLFRKQKQEKQNMQIDLSSEQNDLYLVSYVDQ